MEGGDNMPRGQSKKGRKGGRSKGRGGINHTQEDRARGGQNSRGGQGMGSMGY